jgi:hypothetical protein
MGRDRMNNIFTVVLSVLVGVLAGVSLLLGINNTVTNANVPIFIQVKEMAAKQDELQKKIVEANEGVVKQQQLLENLISKADKMVMAVTQAQVQVQQPQINHRCNNNPLQKILIVCITFLLAIHPSLERKMRRSQSRCLQT